MVARQKVLLKINMNVFTPTAFFHSESANSFFTVAVPKLDSVVSEEVHL